MKDPLHIETHARRQIIEELMVLTGADALNVHQHRLMLEAMSLADVAKLRDEVLAELDARFTPCCGREFDADIRLCPRCKEHV
jgi:cell division protein FtsL